MVVVTRVVLAWKHARLYIVGLCSYQRNKNVRTDIRIVIADFGYICVHIYHIHIGIHPYKRQCNANAFDMSCMFWQHHQYYVP